MKVIVTEEDLAPAAKPSVSLCSEFAENDLNKSYEPIRNFHDVNSPAKGPGPEAFAKSLANTLRRCLKNPTFAKQFVAS